MENSSFSKLLPQMQLAIDSTSLGEAKICFRRYYLNIIQGFVPRSESVHLTFGLHLHAGIEAYHRAAFDCDHESALRHAVHQIMLATWSSGRPWTSDDKYKNRFTLIRTLIWYLDRWKDDPLKTYHLANNRPAVELSFRFDSGLRTSHGEPILLCGHLDRLVQFNNTLWIADIKSTQHYLNQDWFSKFTPNNQFTLYSLAGKIAFGLETEGIIVDGAQVKVNESVFERGLVRRTQYQLDEWLDSFQEKVRELELAALRGKWPQNDQACNLYGGCPYRPVCSAGSITSRDQLLHETYKRRVWDPLQRRGDI